MRQIAVMGAGAMGSGIAQVAAMAGDEVLVYDPFPGAQLKAREGILQSLSKFSAKGKLSDAEVKAVFGRILFIEELETIATCEMVIEAIREDETEKSNLFQHIESIVTENCLLATNTSSLSITALASSLKHPERFLGIHFFNPPVLMQLVEIIPALQSSSEYISQAVNVINAWNKTTVLAKDTPGFIVNRIARPYYSEALRIAEEQISNYEAIDHAMKEYGGFRMVPFELMDFIGNDVNEAVTRSVWTATHYEPRYKPSQVQINLVRAGWLGRKSGRGYYDYSSENNTSYNPSNTTSSSDLQTICDRVIIMLINEAADALHFGIASRDDIDKAMTLGVNYPKGLLKWADEWGIQLCVDRMDALYDFYREDRYRCSPLLRSMAANGQLFYS